MFAPGRGRHSIVFLYEREHRRADESDRQRAALQERLSRTEKELAQERSANQTLRGQLRTATNANRENSERIGVAATADIDALTPTVSKETDSERTLTGTELKALGTSGKTTRSFVVQSLGSLDILGAVPHQKTSPQ